MIVVRLIVFVPLIACVHTVEKAGFPRTVFILPLVGRVRQRNVAIEELAPS